MPLTLSGSHLPWLGAYPPYSLRYPESAAHFVLSRYCYILRLGCTIVQVARVYESYGSFEGALTLLGMIVENFAFTDDLQDDTYERALLR